MTTSEVCLNIWFVADQETQLIYRAAARAYAIDGSDDYKATVLKSLAGSDYHLAKHFSLTHIKNTIVDPNGRSREVCGLFRNSIDTLFPQILDTICKGLEEDFIFQPIITPTGPKKYKMKILADPYYVLTFIIEDDQGNLTPQVRPLQ